MITAYTVDPGTIGDPAGGFLTLDSPAAAGDVLTIVSGIPLDRNVDYQNNADFSPDTVNADNDRQVSQIKQLQEQIDRAVKVPITGDEPVEVLLPPPDPGKVLVGRYRLCTNQ